MTSPEWLNDAPHPADVEDDIAIDNEDMPPDWIEGTKATWGQEPAELAADRLAAMPDVFLRSNGSQLVWIDDRGWADIRPQLQPLDQPTLRGLLNERRVVFASKQWDDTKKRFTVRPTPPPTAVCERIVTTRPGSKWRIIHGIADAPYLLASGELVNEPGFRSGMWLCRNAVVNAALLDPEHGIQPEGWSADRAANFVAQFFAPLHQVEWAAECDRAAAFAYLLTLFTRPAYRLAPIFLFTAPDSGSGKDFVAKCMENAVFGFEAMRINPPKGADAAAAAEMDKKIGAALLAGESTIVLGDITKLESPTLYGLTTEERAQGFRELGVSQAIPHPRNLTLAGVGNNPTIGTDLVRRSISCRIEPRHPEPGARKFDRTQKSILTEYRACRPGILAGLTNIVRGAMRATKPAMMTCDFADWSDIVQASCLYAGLDDPLRGRDVLRESVNDDDPRRILAPIVSAWWGFFGAHAKTASELIAPARGVVDEMNRHYFTAMHESGVKLEPATFGKLLMSCKGKTFVVYRSDGTSVLVTLSKTTSKGSVSYKLVAMS